MRYAELFAGAGGLSLGLERAGVACAWHAEWSDFPRRVLEHHWPDVPLYGDVSTLDGRALIEAHGPIDLLSGGSPCQDLSVAGKRAGLTEGTRSSLFFQQMRLWDETGADLCLWENVAGALSSNRGEDFALVLSAFVGGAVVVPADGWRGAGVVCGRAGVAAWRILDAQFFGVPQRRRRVFVLGTRTGWVDPAQVLALPDRVRRYSQARGEAGEGTSGRAGSGVASESGQGWWSADGSVAPLRADPGGMPSHIAFDTTQITSALNRSNPQAGDPCHPLAAQAHAPLVVSYALGSHAGCADGEQTNASHESGGPVGMGISEEVSHSLRAGRTQSVVSATGEITHALTHAGRNASEDGTGRGTPIVVGYFDKQALGVDAERGVASTVSARDYKDATDIIVADTLSVGANQTTGFKTDVTETGGVPRRLMPIECERLMGWPDNWTNLPGASDSARYKACGNGVASPVAEWIGRQLMAAVTALECAA